MTTVLTMIVKIPINLAAGQYFNFGDTSVMLVGLLFGPWVGLFAGGFGSMLGDVIAQFTGSPGAIIFAPFTFIAKGLEGFLVGLIASPRTREKKVRKNDVLGAICGGAAMIVTYFIVEIFLIDIAWAIIEFPWNVVQITVAAVISFLIVNATWTNITENYPQIRATFYPGSYGDLPPSVSPPSSSGQVS